MSSEKDQLTPEHELDAVVKSDRPLRVCLDTGIYERHHFELSLLDEIQQLFGSRKECVLIVPDVVRMEAKHQYGWQLKQVRKKTQLPLLGDAVAIYQAHWEQWERCLLNMGELVELDLELAREAMRRAVEHEPPCSDGKLARDAFIWLTFLRNVKAHDANGVYVTDDGRFYLEKEGDVRPEARSAGIVILRTFRELKDSMAKALGSSAAAKLAVGAPAGFSFEKYVHEDSLVPTQEPAVYRTIEDAVREVVPGYRAGLEIREVWPMERHIHKVQELAGIKTCDVEEGWYLQLYFEVSAAQGEAHGQRLPGVLGTRDADAMINVTAHYEQRGDRSPEREVTRVEVPKLNYGFRDPRAYLPPFWPTGGTGPAGPAS